MSIYFIPQNINIKISLDDSEYEDGMWAKIYEVFPDDPSSSPTFIASETNATFELDNPSDNPSITSGKYSFTFTIAVRENSTKFYGFSLLDEAGNESEIMEEFENWTYLKPMQPEALDAEEIEIGSFASSPTFVEVWGNNKKLYEKDLGDPSAGWEIVGFYPESTEVFEVAPKSGFSDYKKEYRYSIVSEGGYIESEPSKSCILVVEDYTRSFTPFQDVENLTLQTRESGKILLTWDYIQNNNFDPIDKFNIYEVVTVTNYIGSATFAKIAEVNFISFSGKYAYETEAHEDGKYCHYLVYPASELDEKVGSAYYTIVADASSPSVTILDVSLET